MEFCKIYTIVLHAMLFYNNLKLYKYHENYICLKCEGVSKMYNQENNVSKRIATLFISYTSCDRPIVDLIQSKISEKLQNKIIISRFDTLKYKESFLAFMNTVSEHDFVLAVVSDTYLKSKACMYEISEVLKNHHYNDKLIFVVLSETERRFYKGAAPKKIGADIYDSAIARSNYTMFWQKQYIALNERIKQVISEESRKELIEELQIIGQIYRRDIGEFLRFLSDENGKNFNELYESGFEDLIQIFVSPCHVHKNILDNFIDPQLGELYRKFPQNSDIANSFANALFRLSQNEDEHIVSLVVDYLEKVYCEHPCLDIAHKLMMSLTNLSVIQDDERIKKTVSRVQSLYRQYPDCFEMAVVYAKCLVNCTNHDETLAQAAIEQLQKLYDQYTSNTEIAIYYASGLSNRCFHHESQNVMGLVARLEELYQHHPVEPEISIRYARGLDALSRKQDVSEANSTAQRLKLLYTQNNNIIDIVVVYMQCLVNLLTKESEQGMVDTFACIEGLYNQYPDEPRIISRYAMGLYNYQKKQDLTDTLKYIKCMENLYDKYPHVTGTSQGLARCFVDLSTKQNEETERLYIVARLEYLLDKHPDEDIAVGYAIGLYNLSLRQNKSGLRNTMTRFEDLCKRYPNNERIASEFASFLEECYHTGKDKT